MSDKGAVCPERGEGMRNKKVKGPRREYEGRMTPLAQLKAQGWEFGPIVDYGPGRKPSPRRQYDMRVGAVVFGDG